MPYFLKTKISLKPLEQGLQSIYGLGKKTAKQHCQQSGLLSSTNAKDLRSFHRRQIKLSLTRSSKNLGEDLRYKEHLSYTHLTSLKTYRGLRHLKALPVRGQRTHTNGQTQKRLDRLSKQKKTFTKPRV